MSMSPGLPGVKVEILRFRVQGCRVLGFWVSGLGFRGALNPKTCPFCVVCRLHLVVFGSRRVPALTEGTVR